jgi:hypothetical protein
MTSAAAFFGRIFWMIADPILLAVLALNIAHQGTGWFTLIDLAYFFVLAGMPERGDDFSWESRGVRVG